MSKHLKLPTLLVISDNPSIRLWIKKNIGEQFFILEATKKNAALETILHASLDFIILDAELEDCDPLVLCKEMREHLRHALTPIFLITGRLKKLYRDSALTSGVTDFLSNQLNIEEFEMRIAAGKKASAMREKTIDISSAIQMPHKPKETL